MDGSRRQQPKQLAELAGRWAGEARRLLAERDRVEALAAQSRSQLVARIRPLTVWGIPCTVLPLMVADRQLLTAIGVARGLPVIAPDILEWLRRLPGEVAWAQRALKAETGLWRSFASAEAKQEAQAAAAWLSSVDAFAHRVDLDGVLAAALPPRPALRALEDALEPKLGIAEQLGCGSASVTMLSAEFLEGLPASARAVDAAVTAWHRTRQEVIQAAHQAKRCEASLVVSAMPLERLRDVTKETLHLRPLHRRGWTTVGQVLANEGRLTGVPGLGDATSEKVIDAAHALWRRVLDEVPVTIDGTRRTVEAEALLRALHRYLGQRAVVATLGQDSHLLNELGSLARAVPGQCARVVLACRDDHARQQVAATLSGLPSRLAAYRRVHVPDCSPWEDYLRRAGDYRAALAELGLSIEGGGKVHGDLPEEIIAAVRALELRRDHLHVSLRGYQAFAARFALVQKKVLIGDEMGLGKTIEALAVLAHLYSGGRTHFLVICPAAVVTNWVREVTEKSDLMAHRLHGPQREAATRAWHRRGGVAVTTYETLGWYIRHTRQITVDCLIVDEAHYIKNPATQRSRRSATLMALAPRVILMTGTPLENRVDEFRQLVSYIRPDLALDQTEIAPRRFRAQVAPVYLRRNQEDVLPELPERFEVEEWVPLSGADRTSYREAVHQGNFMAMRQAAMLNGSDSCKIQRLREIVEEAAANGRKVIVYSFFRAVLEQAVAAAPGPVFGPLNGSVPSAKRQAMIDDFSKVEGGAVLIAQVQAGGVGLNIQAASVVVICEPQFKPSTEEQAIARAHRMGQARVVQVHRLLSEEGVDRRLVEILAGKRRVFDDFARPSALAAGAPEAYDLSEVAIARQIIDEERRRLFTPQ